MLHFLQIVTVLVMIGLTYLLYQVFGTPERSLRFTHGERERWVGMMNKPIGKIFTLTSIVGTLTSLATVYVFFLGNSKLFGKWIFVCIVSIWSGAFITNFITKKILADNRIVERLKAPDQVAGVIATIFWNNDPKAIKASALVKYVSLVNIASVIWLEFVVFSDVSGLLVGTSEIGYRATVMFLSTFVICYFTLRYGLRGFVFADLFQSPAIFVGSLIILVGSVITFVQGTHAIGVPEALNRSLVAQLPLRECIVFAVATFFLNGFIGVVTESHWLRVWLYGNREITLQVKGLSWVALLWTILVFVGLASVGVTSRLGHEGVADLLGKMSEVSPVFAVGFWIAGVAALFSTADSSIYSFILVGSFRPKMGTLDEGPISNIRPFRTSVAVSVVFTVLYFLVRRNNLPFEKFVFLLLPISMNIVPAFVFSIRGVPQRPNYLICSIFFYSLCSVFGLIQPRDEFLWTLAAPIAPVIVAFVAWIVTAKAQDK